MTQNNINTKKRRFTHLTEVERGQIAAYLDEGLSLREIARRMGRSPSTISREKKRGTVQQIGTNRKPYQKYFPDDKRNFLTNTKTTTILYFGAFLGFTTSAFPVLTPKIQRHIMRQVKRFRVNIKESLILFSRLKLTEFY